MSEGFAFHDLGGSNKVLAFFKERSEDIAKAVIPQSPTLVIVDAGRPITEVPVGIVLHMIDGSKKMVTPEDAELILNDGILNRMNIRIELFRE